MAAVELAQRPLPPPPTASVKASSGAPASCLAARGVERAPRAQRPVERECGGALEERGGRRDSSARPRPPGRALQLVGDLLVRPERRLREVPGTAVGIGLGIGGGGERPVRGAPVRRATRAR